MTNDDIRARFDRVRAGKLTKSQRILLEYCERAEYGKIIYMSITELAEATGVAEATVLRFCRSLGFRGYQEFKLCLAQELSRGESAGGDDAESVIAGYLSALEDCKRRFSAERAQQAASLIASARTVTCCGAGNSYTAALELHNRLLVLGVASYCERDVHFLNMLLSSRGENDLAVVFSVSGGTKDLIEAMQIARAQGMKILLVTCSEKSPLARYADLVVASAPAETPDEAGGTQVRIVQLFVVDLLIRALRGSDKTRYDDAVRSANAATARKRI